jgi:hypothetical protein
LNIEIEVDGVKLSLTAAEARSIWGQLNILFSPQTLYVPYHRYPAWWEWPYVTSDVKITTDLVSKTETVPSTSDKYTVWSLVKS